MNIEEKIELIQEGTLEIIDVDELKEKLEKEQPIAYTGYEPSGKIHLGHAVVLRKIKQMQDLGHKAVIIIGDFTGKIGDPTGKAKGRESEKTKWTDRKTGDSGADKQTVSAASQDRGGVRKDKRAGAGGWKTGNGME